MCVIQIAKEVVRIQTTARAMAAIDVFTSLAFVAEKNRLCAAEDE